MSSTAPTSGIPILMYHSISGLSTPSFREFTVDPLLFDEQLSALIDAGCRFVTVQDVPALLAEGAGADGTIPVAISIDDGLADAATGAGTVLDRRRVPATLFVPTKYVGDADRLDWSTLQELAAAGLEIASHGHLHLAADVNEPELVRDDAARSRHKLEAHLGRAVTSYAYPFGYCTPAARRAVREAGFSQACAVMDLPAVASDDPFALPRLFVGPETTPEQLVRIIASRPIRLARRWAEAKQRIWQTGRRWGTGWGPAEAGVVAADSKLESYPRA